MQGGRAATIADSATPVWLACPAPLPSSSLTIAHDLPTPQVKSHLQKHRIKVAAQMQAQGLPVPTPSNGGGGGATPAVAAAAQQVAAARAAQLQGQHGTAQPRTAPLKARRPRAPPAGSVVSAESVAAPQPRRPGSQLLAAKASVAAGTARLAQQQHHHAALQQQQYAASVQRRQLLAERQMAGQQQRQWAAGGLAAPATPQQMGFDSPALQPFVDVEAAPEPFGLVQGRGRGQHSHGHGQLAHHAARSVHASQQGSFAGHGGLEMHTMHGMGRMAPPATGLPPQLDPAAGPSAQGSPVTDGSSGGAPAGSAGSDWEALLRMDNLPSPHMLPASRHGSLLRMHAGGGGMQQYGSAGAMVVHPSAPSPPSPLVTHPTAPASLWTTAGAGAEGWPRLGGPAGVPQAQAPAPPAMAALVPPLRHLALQHLAKPAPAPHHASDSDSDHYADLGDLLDMPALLAGGDDAFDALAAGLASPGGAATAGGLPGHRSASSWAIDTSPFF